MRFAMLHQEGVDSMAANVAARHMLKIATCAGSPEGDMHISHPRFPNGWYWVGFENEEHAAAFLGVLRQLDVNFTESQEKPPGVKFGRIDPSDRTVFMPLFGSTV